MLLGNKDVLKLLKSEIKNLTTSQSIVADYILKYPTESAFLTIEQLAREVGTSTTTIMRMAFNLGYSGYVEFQKDLQNILRNQIPQARLKANLQEISRNELLIKCAQTQIDNIKSTLDTLNDEVLGEALNYMMTSSRIYCTGLRMSYTVAYYLNQGMNRLNGKSQLLVSGMGDLPETLLNITNQDLLITVSFPRYTQQTIELAKISKKRGAKVISITDGYNSPLAQYSDVVLPCNYDSNASHNSPLGALFIADYLISALAFQQIDLTNERLEQVEQILSESRILNHRPLDNE